MNCLTECSTCEGYGHRIVQERCSTWYDDGAELTPCLDCDATGFVVDYDALVHHAADTTPAPPPDGCEVA